MSAFASLGGVPVGITSSSVALQICTLTARKSISQSLRKKRKELDSIVLLVGTKLDIKVLISKALINLYFSHDK